MNWALKRLILFLTLLVFWF